MPELPEVETSRRGILPHLQGQTITQIDVRQPQLRWPIPDEIQALVGEPILAISRRSKYLLIHTAKGVMLLHLGMSGSLRVLLQYAPPEKHDHLDIGLANGKILRLNDPRRFGACLFSPVGEVHPLLASLGPEPLLEAFSADYLYTISRNRRVAIKSFLMNSKIVVGVGNIYANEALFLSGIDPRKPAAKLTKPQASHLVDTIKGVLERAIEQGGTTLKDFTQVDGRPGYFAQALNVYGRGGEPCPVCEQPLSEIRMGQRSTVFCTHCQR